MTKLIRAHNDPEQGPRPKTELPRPGRHDPASYPRHDPAPGAAADIFAQVVSTA
jgi:hypothetical protein